MAKEEKILPKEEPSVLDLLKKGLPDAINILNRQLAGLPVNIDLAKAARFDVAKVCSLMTLDKENRKVNAAEKRFNFMVLENYGSEDDKKKIKTLLSKSIDTIKFID